MHHRSRTFRRTAVAGAVAAVALAAAAPGWGAEGPPTADAVKEIFATPKVVADTLGLRVTADEEFEGLDLGEHGNLAYPDFVLATHPVSEAHEGPHGPSPRPSYVGQAVPAAH